MLAANHPWLNEARRPMSSADSSVRCLTSSFSVAPSASCEYRSFQCLVLIGVIASKIQWVHVLQAEDLSKRLQCPRWYGFGSTLHRLVWNQSQKHQRNQAFRRFRMKIWCNLHRISSKEKPTSFDSGRSTHRGAFGMRWLLTILERRCDKTRETQCEFPKYQIPSLTQRLSMTFHATSSCHPFLAPQHQQFPNHGEETRVVMRGQL